MNDSDKPNLSEVQDDKRKWGLNCVLAAVIGVVTLTLFIVFFNIFSDFTPRKTSLPHRITKSEIDNVVNKHIMPMSKSKAETYTEKYFADNSKEWYVMFPVRAEGDSSWLGIRIPDGKNKCMGYFTDEKGNQEAILFSKEGGFFPGECYAYDPQAEGAERWVLQSNGTWKHEVLPSPSDRRVGGKW